MNSTLSMLPGSWLTSSWYATLTAFVAINTLVYVLLSISKILPRLHPTTWFRNGNHLSRRRETRSIYPDELLPLLTPGQADVPGQWASVCRVPDSGGSGI